MNLFDNSGFQICTSYRPDWTHDISIIAFREAIRPTYIVEDETNERLGSCKDNVLELRSEGSLFESPPCGLHSEVVLIVSLISCSEFQESITTISLQIHVTD